MSDAPVIKKTNDYSIFKKSPLNRETNKGHIKRLKREFERENNLRLNPVICNSEMEVISGQHRLEAAKELGLEVFYICDPKVSHEFILTANSVQKSTSLKDVVDFWAKKEKKADYILLQKYMQKTHLSMKALSGLLFGNGDSQMSELLRTGDFMLPADKKTLERLIDTYLQFIMYCHEKRITPMVMFTGGKFTQGFRNLVILDLFEEKIFFRKLDQKWFDLKPQVSPMEWTKLLLSIYNFKNHNPIPEDVVL
jgi:hypothetical protein